MDIDAVEQWTGNAFLVFGDDAWAAGARFDRITIETARAGVQCNTTAGGMA